MKENAKKIWDLVGIVEIFKISYLSVLHAGLRRRQWQGDDVNKDEIVKLIVFYYLFREKENNFDIYL